MKTKLHNNETYSTNRSLETFIWVFGLALLFVVFSYASASANTFELTDEAYINDIPFDTEMVVNGMLIPEFDFEEEEYIDDIPFNTACVTANCKYKKASKVVFEMSEEEYIDDLPFSTTDVAKSYKFNQTINVEFTMDEESYIEDIPFDTYAIARTANQKSNSKLDVLTARSK